MPAHESASNLESLCDVLRPFLRPFIQVLAIELAAEMARARVDFEIDQRSPALAELRISSRMFREAARRGDFPSSRRGRLIVARRRHVEAWLENRSKQREEREPEESPVAKPSLREQAREAIGLPPKPLRALQGGRPR